MNLKNGTINYGRGYRHAIAGCWHAVQLEQIGEKLDYVMKLTTSPEWRRDRSFGTEDDYRDGYLHGVLEAWSCTQAACSGAESDWSHFINSVFLWVIDDEAHAPPNSCGRLEMHLKSASC